jgi:hypothetical protein
MSDRIMVETHIEVRCSVCGMLLLINYIESDIGDIKIKVMPCGCKDEEEDAT